MVMPLPPCVDPLGLGCISLGLQGRFHIKVSRSFTTIWPVQVQFLRGYCIRECKYGMSPSHRQRVSHGWIAVVMTAVYGAASR